MSIDKQLIKITEDFIAKIKEVTEQKENPQIDFRKIPKDTLVLVKDDFDDNDKTRYFSHTDINGKYICHTTGTTSKTSNGACSWWNNIRLLDNDPVPWFGDECPLPDGVRFKVWMRSNIGINNFYTREGEIDPKLRWSWGSRTKDSVAIANTDIIAYQILESDWQGPMKGD